MGELIDSGLLQEAGLAPSRGGRRVGELRFHAEAGLVFVADLGATSITVRCSDLNARGLATYEEPWDLAAGPERTLARIEQLFEQLLTSPAAADRAIWGIGVGLPGPVDFACGRPISPPIAGLGRL